MFETPECQGLIKDIRGGVYAASDSGAPFVSLRAVLGTLQAPDEVMDELARIEKEVTSAVVVNDELLDEARAAGARMKVTWAPPTLSEHKLGKDSARVAADMLFPDGQFTEARRAQAELEAQRIVEGMQSGEIKPDAEISQQ